MAPDRSVPPELLPILAMLERTDRELTDAYGSRFCEHMRRYGHPVTFLLNQAESFAEAALKDAVVLDLGCGFGVVAAAFAALGAKKVIGVDLDPYMIGIGNGLIGDLLPREVASRVELEQRDVLKRPFDPESFDAIVAIDSFSFIQSLEDAIRMIRRQVKPGGRVLVSDGCSGCYVPGRIRRRAMWRDREARIYAHLREKLIIDNFPGLPRPDVRRLAARTRGHTAEDVIGLVRYALATKLEPKPLQRRRMMNPMTGYHEERELNPIALMNRFRSQGFFARLLKPHTKAPPGRFHPRRLLLLGLRALYPLTLPVFDGFRILMIDIRSKA